MAVVIGTAERCSVVGWRFDRVGGNAVLLSGYAVLAPAAACTPLRSALLPAPLWGAEGAGQSGGT